MNTTLDKIDKIEQSCRKIAPLWPLSHFVAVNPFLGQTDQPFTDVAVSQERIHGSYALMPISWFGEKYRSGRITLSHIRRAVANANAEIAKSFADMEIPLSAEALIALAVDHEDNEEAQYQLGTFSAYLDRRESSDWHRLVREEAAKWCAAHFDQGQAAWQSPWKDLPLYQAWKKAAAHDLNLRCNGLSNTKSIMQGLPDDPFELIESALFTLDIPEERVSDILDRTLLILPGWAGYLRYLDRELELKGQSGDHCAQLLAILLAYEIVVYRNHQEDHDRLLGWRRSLMEDLSDTGETSIPIELAQRLLWQSALENVFESRIQEKIGPKTTGSNQSNIPEVQAAFCIDVRSERFRDALENAMPSVQTIGAAGFFGVPAHHHHVGHEGSEARCPAIIAPPVKTLHNCSGLDKEGIDRLERDTVSQRTKLRGWKTFRESAASCFTFVETAGLAYAAKILRDAFGLAENSEKGTERKPVIAETLDSETQVSMAEGILNSLALTDNFARYVLLCGHGGESANNPYASSLDCGACGGHAGDANARLAADLLNREEVRAGLRERGIDIPDSTDFIAGLHNTTTDEVRLFDLKINSQNDSELIERLQAALRLAGETCLAQRSTLLAQSGGSIQATRGRSRDWSQVRPEWGLAGNAAFIIAPRSWTRGENLSGQAFLHDYEPALDPSQSTLKSIMGGPLVVGSWINLQYFASASNNELYGSGHKTIHNVVGGIGVALGNENDLRPGLPLQSVHDGKDLVHEPRRLHACIAAEPVELDSILAESSQLLDLVRNEWIHLIALGKEGRSWLKRLPQGGWLETELPAETKSS